MKRSQKQFRVITKAEDLVKHTLLLTNNTKRFPKKVRFSIVNRIQEEAISIYDNLLEANEIYVKNYKDKEERLALQRKAITRCKKLLFYIELSMEMGYINDRSCEYWGNLVFDVKYMTMAWIKRDSQ